MSTQATNSQENPLAGFGPNEWIVEDMYQRYLADPASVDSAWHDFFADYKPSPDAAADAATAVAAKPAPTKPVEKPAEKPAEKPVEKKAPVKAAVPAAKPAPTKEIPAPVGGAKTMPLRGVAARIVQPMQCLDDPHGWAPRPMETAGRGGLEVDLEVAKRDRFQPSIRMNHDPCWHRVGQAKIIRRRHPID